MKRLLSWATTTALVIGLAVATGPAAQADRADLAHGKPATTSSNAAAAARITDGDQTTYWQSTRSGDQWAQVDLGAVTRLDRAVLTLPAARTAQLSVQTSVDGGAFATARTLTPGSATATVPLGEVQARYVRVAFAGRGELSGLEVYAAPVSNRNLVAAVQSASASSNNAPYNASNAIDGNQASYWESTNNVFPQWIQADLGASLATNRLVLKLPAGWEARTQTITVQQSTNGSSFTDLVASTGYRFDPASGNTVTINVNSVTTRYVRLNITANTGWPAGQLAELEVYGPATGDTQAPTAPGNLAYTQPASGQIALSWQASTDNVGVTAYDVYANGVLRASVGPDVRTYTDNQPASATVSYFVRARDA
ncbi:discoidin domain-containing protein, partial [Actinophytocola sp.]|uniref:discoidin domain-containing protein n=1 Tax=Actinophytocola sp. TaxID=1872138 RepID=UPI003899D1E1